MNLENRAICENQHQALNSYLEDLLAVPPEMSTLTQARVIPSPIAAVTQPVVSAAGLKCFVFTVAGLKLALPLARVTEVVDFSVCGPALRPGVLGHFLYADQQVPVLDSARILMPESHLVTSYQWLVIVDHGSYALACNSVEPNMEVAHDAVRWRTTLTTRRWLAGTLLKQRCALLDADEINPQSADISL